MSGVIEAEGVAFPNKDEYNQNEKPKLDKGAVCMPGQRICIANEYFEAGEGAYEFGDSIYASIVGHLSLQEFPDQELTVVCVRGDESRNSFASPHIMAIVTATVVSRTRKLCRCLITHVGSVKLEEGIRGIIRKEYITDAQRDQQEIHKSFGVGDTVLARIVGIGEGDFIMSTAEDALGVATAMSRAGYYMVPIGWNKMECPKTKEVLERKVAKIIQDRNVDYWHSRNAKGAQNHKTGKNTASNSGDSE